MDTTVNTPATGVANIDLDVVKSALDRLKQRNDKQEIVLSEFPVMQGYSIIPRNAVEDLLSSEGKKANSELVAKFSGEIFSSARLLELTKVRDAVTKRLCSYGTIVGKCCTYVVATADHTDIVKFLTDKKREYDDIVADMLGNYDSIVTLHIQKLNDSIENEQARLALIAKIPTKEKIAERHIAQFRFFKGYCPDEDDLENSASEILAAVELAEKQDLAFVEKVSILFKQFLDNPKSEDALGKRYSAFVNAVEQGLSYERSTKLIMAGSQYENIANAQFELLHQAHANLVAYQPTRTEKYKIAKELNAKFKQVAYVLSNSKELMAFAHGNITVFSGADFIRQSLQSLPKAPRTRSAVQPKSQTAAAPQTQTVVQAQPLPVKEEASTFIDKVAQANETAEEEASVVDTEAPVIETAIEVKVPEHTASDSSNIDFGAGVSIDSFSFDEFLGKTSKTTDAPAETVEAAPVSESAKAPETEPAEMSREDKLSNIEAALAELMGGSSQIETMNNEPAIVIADAEDEAYPF